MDKREILQKIESAKEEFNNLNNEELTIRKKLQAIYEEITECQDRLKTLYNQADRFNHIQQSISEDKDMLLKEIDFNQKRLIDLD